MSTGITAATAAAAEQDDEGYDTLRQVIRDRAAAAVAAPVFTTAADPDTLWGAYLGGLPPGRRRHYDCRACRRFVGRYGGLVRVGPGGVTATVLWSPGVPEFFSAAAANLRGVVEAARVTGVYYSPEAVWGQPTTGLWSHLSATPGAWPGVTSLVSAHQAAAAAREDYRLLHGALAAYPPQVVAAAQVHAAGGLPRPERARPLLEWLADLHARVEAAAPHRRNNVIWQAVATAPAGFCHVGATVVGQLLDWVVARQPRAEIERRWAALVDPLQYQRPSAPPAAGAIDRAEKVFAELGLAPALARRYARLDDLLAVLWTPPPSPPPPAGVFGHLREAPLPPAQADVPERRVTWAWFARTALPVALAVEARVPANGPFYGLLTAADPAAPPLLQWDGLPGHPRNPVSWYVYVHDSPAYRWHLRPGVWTPVTAVFDAPYRWQEPDRFGHHGNRAFFALAGCWDDRGDTQGLGLFPENLRGDLREVRSVIEAYSRRGRLPDPSSGTANGLVLHADGPPVTVRVRTAGGTAVYTLDRWE